MRDIWDWSLCRGREGGSERDSERERERGGGGITSLFVCFYLQCKISNAGFVHCINPHVDESKSSGIMFSQNKMSSMNVAHFVV